MLIIGRRKPRKGNDFGGVVVLYELFLDYFAQKDITYEDIDLNYRNYPNKVGFLLSIYFLLAKAILNSKNQKVSFHGTTVDFTYYAPFVVWLCNLMNKRVTLRKFGGSFDQYFENLGYHRKRLVTYALKEADNVFFETKYLVNEFSELTNGVWFPNVRDVDKPQSYNREFNKRFVFISHVKKTKGINVILEAIEKLSDDYTIHIYGPLQNYNPPFKLEDTFSENYKGVLQPEEVLKTMQEYDVMLLPTFHDGEGYPGAILEAYSQGLPVISTKWRSIPEIVKEGETGYLIEPNSVVELVDAIQGINKDDYSQLSVNALNFFEEFDQEKVMKRIVNYL